MLLKRGVTSLLLLGYTSSWRGVWQAQRQLYLFFGKYLFKIFSIRHGKYLIIWTNNTDSQQGMDHIVWLPNLYITCV